MMPVSGSGGITGGNPNYECCENHGAVTALNLRSGSSGATTPYRQLNIPVR